MLEFTDLVALTRVLSSDRRWRGPRPEVTRETDPAYYGSAKGCFIRYAPRAPACVVVHELAHVACVSQDHGAEFTATCKEIVSWLPR